MANYRAVVRHFPAALEYLRAAKWVRRGDVLAYLPSTTSEAFSTDTFGFRHTWFEGRNIGLADIAGYTKIGFVFGSSHVFGFGLAHNRETLASRLSGIFGYPVFGISYPEADTRTLHTTLLRLTHVYGNKLDRVVLITGGDFTRYCYAEQADPLFGPPFLPQDARVAPKADETRHFANLIHFTEFWIRRFAETVSAAGASFSMLDDVTFFEKSTPEAIEAACELGVPLRDQSQRFDTHHRRALAYQAERRRIASNQGVLLAPFPAPGELLFIDEFHYRAETQERIAQALSKVLADAPK